MNGDWSICTVAELQEAGRLLVEDGNHGEYRPRQNEFSDTGVAFIRAADMNEGRVLFHSASRINETALSRIRKGIGRPCDVLLSHKGTVGKVALTSPDCEPFVCSPQTTFWRTLDSSFLNYRFLFYYLQSPYFQDQLSSRKGETDMADYVSLTVQRTLQVAIPSIDEQCAIAHILGSLDDKIELNRQMNETLESIARALFKSWFVDFDPVRAKMEGRQPYGMDAETAALFPDSFEDSAFGKIPKGWNVKSLSDCVIYLSRGIAPSYLHVSPIRVLNQRAIRWWHIDEQALKFHDPNKPIRKEAYIRKGDVVINSTGDITIGRAYWFYHEVSNLFADSHVSIIRTSPDILLPEMVVFQVETQPYQDIIYSYVTGSTGQLELNRSNLAQLPFLCPPIEVQRKFSAIIEPWFNLVWNNKEQSRVLAALRDALLPKLLSGEIRVKDAEKFVEANA